jgi:hypothetical protein
MRRGTRAALLALLGMAVVLAVALLALGRSCRGDGPSAAPTADELALGDDSPARRTTGENPELRATGAPPAPAMESAPVPGAPPAPAPLLLPRAADLTVILEETGEVAADAVVIVSLRSIGQELAWPDPGVEGADPVMNERVTGGARPRRAPRGGGERSRWLVSGLLPGRVLAAAWSDPGAPAWEVASVEASEQAATVRLRAAGPSSYGTVRVDLRAGGQPVVGGVEWRVDGIPWRALPTAMPEGWVAAPVPAGRDVEVGVTAGPDTPRVALPAPQTVRVAAGEQQRIAFDFDPRVVVQLTLPADAGAEKATVYLWRLTTVGQEEYVGTTSFLPGGKAAGPLHFSPGTYEALVTDAGVSRPPTRTTFHVAPPGPLEVVLSLPQEPRTFRLRLVTAGGEPVSGAGLWLGRMEGASPSEAVVAMATTGEDGWATFPVLPAGDFAVADYFRSTWCDLELARSPPEDVVLVRGEVVGERVTLDGRVWGPDGRPMASAHAWVRVEGAPWGKYAAISQGAFQMTDLPAGKLVVSVPHAWMREGRHGPVEVRVSVVPGEKRSLEIRLPPR